MFFIAGFFLSQMLFIYLHFIHWPWLYGTLKTFLLLFFPDDCSDGVEARPVTNRASSAMWMFSTGLCVVVGIMVIAGVAYQIHLDKISKRKKEEHKQQRRGKQINVFVYQ